MRTKRSLILIFITLFSISVFAQKSESKDIYAMLDQYEESFEMSFSKTLIDAIDMDIDVNGKSRNVIGDFEEGRFIVISNEKLDYTIKKISPSI